jgi:hypothetical protein
MPSKRAGTKLRESIAKALPNGWAFDEREDAILDLAAAQADDLAKVEKAIKDKGTMVKGSAGQPVLNPAITEARQSRLTISRLLGELQLPDEASEPRTAAGKRGQKAARARWDDVERKREMRRHGTAR